MNIRHYAAADADSLSELYRRSVLQLGIRHYAADQVAAWASLTPSPQRLQELSEDGRTRLVAVGDDASIHAFADLEPDGHIHFLYCAPESAGSGVTAALYDALEGVARSSRMPRLYAEASEAAQRFFLRRGFVITARRDFEVAGVPIHNYAVEKSLDLKGQ